MNSTHLISQVQKHYPLLADKLDIKDDDHIQVTISEQEVMQGASLVNDQAEVWKGLGVNTQLQLGYGKVRDISFISAGFCHGAIFYLNENESIIVTVNVIFKIIGIHFDHFEADQNHMAVPGARSNTVSYWPYTKQQAEGTVNITDILLAHFPGYVVFNNFHAILHVRESLIFNYEEKDINLYQVLFSTNIHSAI